MSSLNKCERSPRPVRVGVKTLWPDGERLLIHHPGQRHHEGFRRCGLAAAGTRSDDMEVGNGRCWIRARPGHIRVLLPHDIACAVSQSPPVQNTALWQPAAYPAWVGSRPRERSNSSSATLKARRSAAGLVVRKPGWLGGVWSGRSPSVSSSAARSSKFILDLDWERPAPRRHAIHFWAGQLFLITGFQQKSYGAVMRQASDACAASQLRHASSSSEHRRFLFFGLCVKHIKRVVLRYERQPSYLAFVICDVEPAP
jgi:hypothetical protein